MPTREPTSEGKRHLPVLPASSLRADGHREPVHPADVTGRFTRARHVVFTILGLILVAVPWIRIEGRPALFLDVPARRFFAFGHAFNAQDFWLVFFLLSAVLFALLVVTTVLGRVWCGWACPQTVFLEGAFRPIERLIEGPRNERIRRNAGPRDFAFFSRKIVKHSLFVALALLIAHAFLAYFVSIPSLLEMMQRSPAEHPTAFTWVAILSGVFYGNFAWFREQLCLVICPYGRLQSVLTDDDSLVVGYDAQRGEERRKGKDREGAGDCVDCGRCVAVCPTGIDIRNGLQIDCVGCAECVDACDEIMVKLGKPRGLVRYDSLRGLRGGATRFLRPRVLAYGVLGLIGATVAFFALSGRTPFEATLLRMRGAPYVVEGDVVRNTFQLHVVNKEDHPIALTLETDAPADAEVTLPESLELAALESRPITVLVRFPRGGPSASAGTLTVIATLENEDALEGPDDLDDDEHDGEAIIVRTTAPLLAPR